MRPEDEASAAPGRSQSERGVQADAGDDTRHSATVRVVDTSPSAAPRLRRAAAQTELEAAFFRALTSTSEPFVAVSASSVVLYWSAGATRLLGYEPADVVGQSLSLTLPALSDWLDGKRAALRLGKPQSSRVKLANKAGAEAELAIRAVPAVDEAGEVLATLVQFSGENPASAALPAQELGSELLHELNNILATIQMYASFAADASSSRQAADLEVVLVSARHGIALLRDSPPPPRDGARDDALVDVKEVVRRLDERLRRAVGPGVELAIQLPLGPLHVRASAEELEQVLLTIAHNARDAMSGSGTLHVSVRNTAVGESHPLAAEVPLGSHALISLRDTGVGIGPEHRARLFEPLFTTKPRGRTQPFGLALVRATLEALKGAVRVESQPGKGADFQLFLPLALVSESAGPSPTTPSSAEPEATVLVVEDDAELRSGIRRVLEAEGIDVLEAADGSEAELIAARHPGQVQLLLSDLTLPRADGRDVLTRLRQLRPDLGAVFISGKAERAHSIPAGTSFLQKPFAAHELLASLRMALAAAPEHGGRLAPTAPVVLIVDDDDEMREAFARVIEECDFQVLRAKSGLHALRTLEQRHVDVVICDQFMPGMDGVRLLELVRERFPRCVRVLFTAHPASDVVLDAVNRGGVHKVLVKTMHAVAIRDEIERAVWTNERFAGRQNGPASSA